jgi:UDP-N-acetylmuramate dehydrogenase
MGENAWRKELAGLFPAARFAEPLSKHTTFRIGGPADAYVEAQDVGDLKTLYRFAKSRQVPIFLIGWGSNLLVRDGGVRGIVLRLRGEFEKIRILGKKVWAGAGVRLPQLVLRCAAQGLSGAEPLVGVPGSVGGALVMNAGTREGEIGDLVREVEFFDRKDLKSRRLSRGQLRFHYRRSNLEGKVLLGAVLELKAGDKVDIIRHVRENQLKRLRTQPIHSFNVGSVFKNPPHHFVAKLIEEAGLKGRVLGGARISPKHANFIENYKHARACDVLGLVELARAEVHKRTGIDLELEMKVVGEETPCSPAT